MFFNDPEDVGNLISGSSAFSKSSLNICKLLVYVLLSLHWRILSITLPTKVRLVKAMVFPVVMYGCEGKGVCQGCTLSPCLFNFYAEYIMRNAGLDEAQTGIKIAGRNINNLRYAVDTTLMEESEEELKSLLMKVKEESEKACLKLNIQKTKIMASSPITSGQIDGETMDTVTYFIFLGSKITADGDCSHETKRCLLLGRKARQHVKQT